MMHQVVVSQHTGYARNASESAYPNLWRGLVGWWCPSINPRGGNRLFDLSPFRNHGTLTNMTNDDWVVSGGAGALDFDGSNDLVSTDNGNRFGLGEQYAVSLWAYVKALPTSGNLSCLLCSYDVVTNVFGFDFRLYNNSGTQQIGFTMGDGSLFAGGGDVNYTLTTNAWTSLVAVRNQGALNIWINGVSTLSISNSKAIAATQKALFFASFGSYTPSGGANLGRYFNGQLDDVRLYNRALTPPEIRQLASRRGIGLQPRPKQFTYYQFPSGSKRRRILTGMT